MCIRDSLYVERRVASMQDLFLEGVAHFNAHDFFECHDCWDCLLYTSDAADERSSVDLGGRRIIKKKKTGIYGGRRDVYVRVLLILVAALVISLDLYGG